MKTASWNGEIIAKSDKTVVIEGNDYFPPESIIASHFKPSTTHTTCSWKGVASYYDIVVGGETNKDAAWYYPDVKDAANEIKGYVAFWKGVKISDNG
jgi:uncharacterized protein (DUF427 family)